MARVTDELVTKLDLVGLGGWTSGMERMTQGLGLVDAATTRSSQRLLGYGLAAGAAAAAMGTGVMAMVNEAANLQSVEAGFATMLGSAEAAKKMMEDLKRSEAGRRFGVETTAGLAQTLKGFGMEANKIMPTLQALGDAMAARGKGKEDLEGAALALGQIQAKGKLSAEEVLQLAERGLPVYKILQKELGLSQQQMANLGNAGIDANKAISAIVKGLGTDYAGGMAKSMLQYKGAVEAARNSYKNLLAESGDSLLGPFTAAARGAAQLMDTLNGMPDGVKRAVGPAAAALTVGLGGAAILLSLKLKLLAADNTILMNQQLNAAKAGQAEGAAVTSLAGGLTAAAGRSEVLMVATQALARAHIQAAEAAELQNIAEGGAGKLARGSGSQLAQIGITSATMAGIGKAADKLRQVVKPASVQNAAQEAEILGETAKATGRIGRQLPKLGKMGTPAAILASVGVDLALGAMPEEGAVGDLKHALRGAALGAGMGMRAGLPGALAGAALGAAYGGYENIANAIAGDPRTKERLKAEIAAIPMSPASGTGSPAKAAGLGDVAKQLEQTNALLKQIRDGGKLPFDTGAIAGGQQVGALEQLIAGIA